MKATQERLAAGCDTIVLTEVDAAVHRPGAIERALLAAGATRRQDARFDLLTVADFKELTDVDNPDHMSVVAGDIKTALSLHDPEQLLVMTYGNPAPLVSTLRHRPEFRGTKLKIHGLNLWRFVEPEPMTRLLISCMDYRMQGQRGGLIERLAHAAGSASYGVLATTGGAKELASPSTRRAMVVAGIKLLRRRNPDLKQIAVAAHTDCGKYGGHGAFKDRIAELEVLSNDANEAALGLAAALEMPVMPLIAMIEDDRLVRFRAPVDKK